MKDYKQLYLKTFFFWQEAYGRLNAKYEDLLKKYTELLKELEEFKKK